MYKKILNIIAIFCLVTFSLNIVYADDEMEDEECINIQEETIDVSNNLAGEPKLDSRIAVIYDRKTNRVLFGKQENKKSAMASTTKIMTCIVVLENAKLSDEVTISAKSAGTGGSRLKLKKGDKITVLNLLYGLMLRSGNDAAVALAEHVGGSIEGFAELMNKKAEELGLKNTHFVTPHGLDDPEHYTTALELAKLTDYALENEMFSKIVNTKSCAISINNNITEIANTNELLGVLTGVNGVKTGFTNNAGRCLVTSVNRNDMNIITVVLGADTKKIRTSDSIKLIEYAYKNYKEVNLEKIINEKFVKWKEINEKQIQIIKGKSNNIELVLDEIANKTLTIKEGDSDKLNIEINCLCLLEAPVKQNEIIGQLRLTLGEEVIETINIKNRKEIKRKDSMDYLRLFLKEMTVYN